MKSLSTLLAAYFTFMAGPASAQSNSNRQPFEALDQEIQQLSAQVQQLSADNAVVVVVW